MIKKQPNYTIIYRKLHKLAKQITKYKPEYLYRKDLIHDTILALLEKGHDIESVNDNYLFIVMRNIFIQRERNTCKKVNNYNTVFNYALMFANGRAIESGIEADMDTAMILQWLNKKPSKSSFIMTKLIEGYKARDIASEFNYKIRDVTSLTEFGRRQFRKTFKYN